MLLPRKQDAIHKGWLLRLLTAICENPFLSQALGFKGGTCAAMRGFLDRFSVDLDFDILTQEKDIPKIHRALETVFSALGLTVHDKSRKIPQYFLKYPVTSSTQRNTLQLDAAFPVPKSNRYEKVRLTEIDRIVQCQTLETLVANKLVALIARFERTDKIAARDLYDVHRFFFRGYDYAPDVILEQRKESLPIFFESLILLVEKHVTNTVIDQDLNYLLPPREFQAIRKILKQETIMLLKTEVERIIAR